jgi:hypothetical protein
MKQQKFSYNNAYKKELTLAIDHHKFNRIEEAEKLYKRRILV